MPARYIPALIIVIALIGSTIYFYNKESAYISGMSIAPGEVVALGSKSTSTVSVNGNKSTTNTQAIVEFTASGATYKSEGRAFGYPDWKIGQEVHVYYLPANPEKSRIKRVDEVYFYTAISGFFALCCFVFGSINYLVFRVRGRPLS